VRKERRGEERRRGKRASEAEAVRGEGEAEVPPKSPSTTNSIVVDCASATPPTAPKTSAHTHKHRHDARPKRDINVREQIRGEERNDRSDETAQRETVSMTDALTRVEESKGGGAGGSKNGAIVTTL